MTDKPPRTLQQMASEAATSGGGLECPKCGCRDFRTYRTEAGKFSTTRYKACRHCGHRVLTSTVASERIVRDVSTHDTDDDEEETSIKLRA